MTKMEYLKLLVDEIHSTTVATIAEDGYPQTIINFVVIFVVTSYTLYYITVLL